MSNNNKVTKTVSLRKYGITKAAAAYQLSPSKLQKITLEKNMGREAFSGGLSVNTGEFTGRSPLDRFIVKDEITSDNAFRENFKKFDSCAKEGIKRGGPQRYAY